MMMEAGSGAGSGVVSSGAPGGVMRPADPCAMVIFGAFGDLTKRLVVPALYNLARTGVLPANFALIGVDRVAGSLASWQAQLHDMLSSFVGNAEAEFQIDGIDAGAWARLAGCMEYVQGDLTDAATYGAVAAALAQAERAHGTGGNALFYLAIADRFFATVVDRLGEARLTEGGGWRRVVVEKPFGHDLASARALNARLLLTLREEQIFRIDHFVGKETVQNIMALRFANGVFEPLWNRDHIDQVQITVAETVGVERRGKFYEPTGALRDMVPNHLFALLAMVAMEPPVGFDATAVRNRKADVFAAMPAVVPERAVRGQYGAGRVMGRPAGAYRSAPDVAVGSATETFVALQMEVDNWRWAGVPFFLRTGKNMAARLAEIAIQFKQAPQSPFAAAGSLAPNWMVLRLEPAEGISIEFEAKRPGAAMALAPVRMQFTYADWFEKAPNVGYETLLYDVMIGDATLFMRADMAEQSWRVVQPVLDAWAAAEPSFPNYASGSEGPAESDELLWRAGGRRWRQVAVTP